MTTKFLKEAERQKRELDRRTAVVGSVFENAEQQLESLEKELKADREGLAEYEAAIYRLEKRKAELHKQLAADRKWCKEFDEQMGPYEARYATLTDSIEGLYGEAKERHAEGIQILIDKFNYHPAFRRWSDDFTASPFKPK